MCRDLNYRCRDIIDYMNVDQSLKELNVLSLFSGCGGMDLGFEGDFDVLEKSVNLGINPHWNITKGGLDGWVHLPKNSFNTVFANDISPDAKNAWGEFFSKKGIKDNVYHLESIVDLVKKHLAGKTDVLSNLNVDIVTGGFPCQDFSVAGKRMGLNSSKSHTGILAANDAPSIESRGQLYMWMREVIGIIRPRLFIAENVKGLTNLNDVKTIIENDFRSIGKTGYIVIEARVLHAADYGVPQSRERVIFFGFRKDALTSEALNALSQKRISKEYDPYPPVTHSYTIPPLLGHGSQLKEPVTCMDAFIGLKEPSESLDLSQQHFSKAKYMGKKCQGQTEVNLFGIAPTIRSEHHGNIEYRRLPIEHGGKNIIEFEAGKKERRLTVRECARLQTFPDDYEFVFKNNEKGKSLSASSAYKTIGNAVPPLLAYHIAKHLEGNWVKYFK